MKNIILIFSIFFIAKEIYSQKINKNKSDFLIKNTPIIKLIDAGISCEVELRDTIILKDGKTTSTLGRRVNLHSIWEQKTSKRKYIKNLKQNKITFAYPSASSITKFYLVIEIQHKIYEAITIELDYPLWVKKILEKASNAPTDEIGLIEKWTKSFTPEMIETAFSGVLNVSCK